MPEKKIVQDIRSSSKRSIRNVPMYRVEASEEIVEIKKERIRITPPSLPVQKISQKTPKRRSSFSGMLLTFVVVFLGITVIAIALSLLYSKASVTITPKVANFDIKGTFTARKSISGSSTSTTIESLPTLSYEVITKSDSSSQTIVAADGPLIQTKAKGTATLYNEQTTPQKIVAGTRLANTTGLIYRTAATVTIPSMSGKTVGTVPVEIVADQAGAEYNMSTNDDDINFKLVAYKGTPKYSTVHGKVRASVAGGFSGNKKIISPTAEKTAIQDVESSLKTQLVEEIRAQVPKNSIFYDNAYNIEYDVADPVSKDADTAIISVKATMYGLTFNKDLLLKSIANREVAKFPSPSYDTKGLEDLSFTIVNSKDFSSQKSTPLVFTLSGPVKLIGTFSETQLKNELKGTYLKQSNAIFSHYPAIASAYALITPFWMRSFPNSPDSINIEMKN